MDHISYLSRPMMRQNFMKSLKFFSWEWRPRGAFIVWQSLYEN